jgi:hypothetical protein
MNPMHHMHQEIPENQQNGSDSCNWQKKWLTLASNLAKRVDLPPNT